MFVVLKTMAFAPSVTKMLADLALENLTSRRSSQQLVFLYKVVWDSYTYWRVCSEKLAEQNYKPRRFDSDQFS